MHKEVSIIRSDESLEKAINRLTFLQRSIELLYKSYPISTSLIEVRNMISVALTITQQSVARKENKGAFYSVSLC